MWDDENNCIEYLYLPDGRVIRYSVGSLDRNLFELWLAEAV